MSSETPTIKIPRSTHWKAVILFTGGAAIFWFAEFALQYWYVVPGIFAVSLVRASALAGATLIGCALFSSAIFKWFPRTAQYWRLRRYLGVSGFVFTAMHVFAVYYFYLGIRSVETIGNIALAYPSLNPFQNPIVFGTIASPIFFAMAITSTDWAVQFLTPKRWKFLHRFVYVAYLSSILHFLAFGSGLINNAAGYLLLTITALALFGELYWFFKTAAHRRFRSMGTFVGCAIIVIALVAFFFLYK